MAMFEKVMLKEKKIMISAKVELLRLARTAEGVRTVGTLGTSYKVVHPCNVGFQLYLFNCTVQNVVVWQVSNAIFCHILGPVGKI